ncbi:hypothetical protein BSKO_11876 [Bryopsis sp. KO-2023]|nr:hypothetical protein BSKO_11876 [Bryopsis sp. KO-2023]
MELDDRNGIERDKEARNMHPLESSRETQRREVASTDVGVSLERAGRQLREWTMAMREYLPQCDRDQHDGIHDVAVESASRFQACLLPYADGVVRRTRRCCDDFQALTLRQYQHSERRDEVKRLRIEVCLAKSLHELAMVDFQASLAQTTLSEDIEIIPTAEDLPHCPNTRNIFADVAKDIGRKFASVKMDMGAFGAISLAGASVGVTAAPMVGGTAAGAAAGAGVFAAAFLAIHHKYQGAAGDLHRQFAVCEPLEIEETWTPPEYPQDSLMATVKTLRTAMMHLDLFLGEMQAIVSFDASGATDFNIEKNHKEIQAKARDVVQSCNCFQECAVGAASDLLSMKKLLEGRSDMEAWMEPLKDEIERCGLTGRFPAIMEAPAFTSHCRDKVEKAFSRWMKNDGRKGLPRISLQILSTDRQRWI